MADIDSGDMEEIEQGEELVARVAAIDIAKASGMVCVRVPREETPGKRVRRVFNTVATSGAILALADPDPPGRHPGGHGGHLDVLEALLLPPGIRRGLECWLVNARDVKNVPGRPKTDRLDAVWPAPSAACSAPLSCPRSRSVNRATSPGRGPRPGTRRQGAAWDGCVRLWCAFPDVVSAGCGMIEGVVASVVRLRG
ncbi:MULTISPECIES: hypothetical protein [unclassified Streptomyces]|uniref:hypothetical protein n=1 Tax=unclassified Streptomyces TaxID=2593676 RepID=UPI0022718653|nr:MULTISPECIES: hypothetical protein [unclassified Streptomyces]MCY0924004.1 hypothetical protein [Streptomyces sp. H27-G5]MCY0962869.1 hypothetical protein [Streptomyces sp. H27-H5]